MRQNHGRKFVRIIVLFIAFIVIAGYSYAKTKDFIGGPRITVVYPVNGDVVTENPLEIVGVAKRIAFISLDDRQIYTDDDGNFTEQLLLYPGYNIIKIHATDRFKREVTENIEVNYKPKIEHFTNNI